MMGPTTARSIFVLALAAALALPPGLWPQRAAAQESQGPAIRFLNPSDYGEFKAASARDMEEHGYHIVTSVNQVPPDARVRLEIESSSAGRRRIGFAERQGDDTFALRWQIPPAEDLPSGTYAMTAVLFSGNNQVAEESVDISVEQSWPTVRIASPSNAETAGFYKPAGDDARWHTVMDYTFSSGTEIVAFFYSTSPAGQEPEWTGCGSVRVSSRLLAGAEEPGSGRHLCRLGEDQEAAEVTALAAIATDDPFPLPRMGNALLFGDTSGDAHRVEPYEQIPQGLDLSVESEEGGPGARQYETETCTEQIVARVRDQHGRPVAGVNVDAHATGPEQTEGMEGLRFDVSTGSQGTDANQPPDENHSDETTAWSCAPRSLVQGPGPSGSQGNHRSPQGGETRHIEASGGGTNLRGRFRFRLYNDVPGPTQVSAWADLDDDDRFCSREPAAHLGLGWNQPPPGAQPHAPEVDDCEIPGLATASDDRTTHARKIGINFRRKGGRLVIKGRVRVETGHQPCRRRVPVRIQRRKGNRWKALRTTSTNGRGRYGVRVAHRPGRYRAVAVRTLEGADNQHLCRRAAAKKKYRRRGSGGRTAPIPAPQVTPRDDPALLPITET